MGKKITKGRGAKDDSKNASKEISKPSLIANKQGNKFIIIHSSS